MVDSSLESLSFTRLVGLEDHAVAHPKSLVDLAYEQLLSMLVTMKIQPGAHIGIEALARRLEISQTPIREALTLLEAQKLAYKIPNVGFRAAELLTYEEVQDLFDLRLLIEPAAAAFAAVKANDSALQALARLSDEMAHQQTANELAYAQFAESDARLHHLVASASGNRFIAETLERLHTHLHIFRVLFKTNATTKAVQEHSKIIAALLARDAAGADLAMREHLEASRARMSHVLKERDFALQASGEEKAPGRARRKRAPKT